MNRIGVCLAAMLFVAGSLHPASAQTEGSKTRLTVQKLKEMKAQWSANRPKLKACRAEARKKGLAGDDRWFFLESCMGRS